MRPKPLIIEDDGGVEIELPTKWAVCGRCRGDGVHDHPAFANGISQEEFAEDPDFKEDYFRGKYDVVCTTCHGERVTSVPDWDRMTEAQKVLLQEHYQAERDFRAEEAAERRMGA